MRALLVAALASALALGACRGGSDAPVEPEKQGHGGPACASCHLDDFKDVSHPQHVGKKPLRCEVCHSSYAWHPKELNHAWPLEGHHLKADCFDCHKGQPPAFEGTRKRCVDCHEKDLEQQNAKNPWHAKEGNDCERCHAPTGWKPSREGKPAASAAPTTEPTAAPTATATATVKPKPKPTVKQPPPPPPTTTKPDIHTGPSGR